MLRYGLLLLSGMVVTGLFVYDAVAGLIAWSVFCVWVGREFFAPSAYQGLPNLEMTAEQVMNYVRTGDPESRGGVWDSLSDEEQAITHELTERSIDRNVVDKD